MNQLNNHVGVYKLLISKTKRDGTSRSLEHNDAINDAWSFTCLKELDFSRLHSKKHLEYVDKLYLLAYSKGGNFVLVNNALESKDFLTVSLISSLNTKFEGNASL